MGDLGLQSHLARHLPVIGRRAPNLGRAAFETCYSGPPLNLRASWTFGSHSRPVAPSGTILGIVAVDIAVAKAIIGVDAAVVGPFGCGRLGCFVAIVAAGGNARM